MNLPEANDPVTPAGSVPVKLAPVAPPPTVYTIGVNTRPEHIVGVAEPLVNTIEDTGFTVIV